ncbi:MAG: aldehyde dehydrogenase family protein, partial [Candidatus Kapaibacterium sp.]
MMRTADDARMLRSVNPATLGIIADTDIMSDEEIDQIIRSAHRRFTAWRSVPVEERAARLDALAASLRRYAETAADIISIEMGKPVTQARAEIEKCAVACVYYAREAPSMLASEGIPFDGAHARLVHEPLGVLLAIMPWNLPYWQSIRALVPAIVAGNTVVIKPAPEVTLSAESLQRIIQDAGLGDGIVSTLRANVEQTGRCIEHRHVAGVTFPGSTGAGRAVTARAGQALKKTVLELGGSDAVLVCSDADV